jgi:replication initiation and membrane attachment protein DnaB
VSAEHKAEIRDRRKPGWFRVDDELIEVYGPEIGVHGIAVYAAICKHADSKEESKPGLRRLCAKLKIGREKLLKTLAKLEEVGLISIEPGDRNSVNVYTLLDVP